MIKLLLIIFVSTASLSCKKDMGSSNTPTGPTAVLPALTTVAMNGITNTTALSGGNINSDGGSTVTVRGVCWSTTPNPLFTGAHTIDGTGTGIFTSNITGLTANTLYHIRAYAINSIGTAYGNELSFTTSSTNPLPTVSTTSVTSITINTAAGGGNVLNDGGTAVTARGVCWSTTVNPIATGNHTTDGNGTGTFTSTITGLSAGTTYHVRAYATNNAGTAYGTDISFTTASPDIYTAGSEWNGTTDIAKGWTNSIETFSTSSSIGAVAYGVFVSGSDVYMCGHESIGSNWSATVWKNGIATHLSNSPIRAYALSVFVSGTDVYVVGYEQGLGYDVAKLWKNGVATSLTTGATYARANSVFVSGTDVYIAGYEVDGPPYEYVAKVWKNGVATSLSNGLTTAMANSVFVSGTDVYVAGRQRNGSNYVAMLWKNGVATSLSGGNNSAAANSVFVSGTDVYVAGGETSSVPFSLSVAKYWKNGVPVLLTGGATNAYAYSISVSGTDVYVGGEENNPSGRLIPKYWKNGTGVSLSNGVHDSRVKAIFVK